MNWKEMAVLSQGKNSEKTSGLQLYPYFSFMFAAWPWAADSAGAVGNTQWGPP